MAIVIQARISGLTQEQYDAMAPGVLPQLKKAPGFLAHAGGPIPGGWQVTEFWESLEQHEAWIKGPAMAPIEAIERTPPNISIFQAHTVVVR